MPAPPSSSGSGGYIPRSRMVYDGKRMRKAITRRTVEYNASILRGLRARHSFERSGNGLRNTLMQPHPDYIVNVK